MEEMTTKLSCKKLTQVISIKKTEGYWRVELRDTKNIILKVKHNTIVWQYTDYEEALSQYISVVAQQARHIALISL